MKRYLRLPLAALLLTLLLFAFALPARIAGNAYAASTYAYNPYSFEFTKYSVVYDINADLTMNVTEDFTILYTGVSSTGILRDIPVNMGDRVRNIKAYEITGGEVCDVDYTVESQNSDFVTVNIGDTTNKTNESHNYRITYEYAVTKPADKNTLYLNAIGFGSEGAMSDVTVTLKLPDGFKDGICYAGYGSGTGSKDFTREGNTIVYTTPLLVSYSGVTFELQFEEGVLSTRADIVPYIVFIVGCLLLGIVIVLKLLKFNKGKVTVVPNFDACDRYDPLMMGKLLDNSADNEDITSLIYYWADRGYLKINMEDKDDPELIRLVVNLPSYMPEHQRIMFDGLFASGDCVKISSLKNRFYMTVDAVKKSADAAAINNYNKTSVTASIAFAVVGGLVAGLAPMLLALFTINMTFIFAWGLFMIIPALAAMFLVKTVRERSTKYSKAMVALCGAGIALLCAAVTAGYTLLIPSYIVEVAPKILLCIISFAIACTSALLICRTDEYDRELGYILGFKDFIENVEKDKLETMLEGNPELYYKVLPYAQVLGVSDIWEKKFSALTVQPPAWAVGYGGVNAFDLIVFNAAMRSMRGNMARTFVSRPSSRGLSGGGHGRIGGFGGGGHGGGGFRGR